MQCTGGIVQELHLIEQMPDFACCHGLIRVWMHTKSAFAEQEMLEHDFSSSETCRWLYLHLAWLTALGLIVPRHSRMRI